MLREEHEPSRAEEGGVDTVHHGIQDVYPGQCNILQGQIGATDGGHEPCCEAEYDEGVDVVGELERV